MLINQIAVSSYPTKDGSWHPRMLGSRRRALIGARSVLLNLNNAGSYYNTSFCFVNIVLRILPMLSYCMGHALYC